MSDYYIMRTSLNRNIALLIAANLRTSHNHTFTSRWFPSTYGRILVVIPGTMRPIQSVYSAILAADARLKAFSSPMIYGLIL